MALPITTKPGIKNNLKRVEPNQSYSRYVFLESSGTRYAQVKPFDLPLPFSYQMVVELSCERKTPAGIVPDVRLEKPADAGSVRSLAYERAFDKLTSALRGGQGGDLAVTLGQTKLTYRLYRDYLDKFVYMRKLGDIADTLNRFAVFTRHAATSNNRTVRQRYRNKAARVLGCRPTTDREVRRKLNSALLRTGSSSFAAEYLAFHYGWSPLFKEIYEQLRMLSEGINYPSGYYTVGSSGKTSGRKNANVVVNHYRVRVQLGAVAQVSNELAYCLGVVGLANPAAVAWDLVKWSFVADWIASIGPRLQRQTDHLGIGFRNGYQTTFEEGDYSLSYPGYNQSARYVQMTRTTNFKFPVPAIRVKNPIGRDWGKAFAQVSLLTMFGLKPKRG